MQIANGAWKCDGGQIGQEGSRSCERDKLGVSSLVGELQPVLYWAAG